MCDLLSLSCFWFEFGTIYNFSFVTMSKLIWKRKALAGYTQCIAFAKMLHSKFKMK